MTRTNQDIPRSGDERYIAGDTAVLTVTVSVDGGDKDLTDSSASFALSQYPGAEPLVEKDTAGGGVTITNPGGGVVEVAIEPEDTASLGHADGVDYYYELVVQDDEGNVATVTTGTWTIHADTATLP